MLPVLTQIPVYTAVGLKACDTNYYALFLMLSTVGWTDRMMIDRDADAALNYLRIISFREARTASCRLVLA